MIIGADPFYSGRAQQLAVLAARHALPMISAVRELLAAGGLISYGNSVTDAYRRVGALTGRILKGAKPADTPIDRATKFELVINLGTAKALGLQVPDKLLALAAHVPTMLGVREYVEAGGLMSYGPNWPHMWGRAADLVDKILRGAKPADVPVEQPTKFDLVINLTTAKALGLQIPDKLLALADEVIE